MFSPSSLIESFSSSKKAEKLYDKKPGEALKLAVKRMLPGGPLAKKQLTKLKIYKGSEHPHSVQNPKIIALKKNHAELRS